MPRVRLNLPVRSPEEKNKPRGRPFEAGNTMGKGRPKGSLNKITRLTKEIWGKYAEEIAENTAILARSGDSAALRIFWDRVFPTRPGAPVEFDLPLVRYADDVAPAYAKLLQALANGEVTPAEAVQITRVLEAQAKVVAFQFGPPWEPDTKALVERFTKMREQDAKAAETHQHAEDIAA